MQKYKTLAIYSIPIVIFIFIASILGENHRINSLANEYLAQLQRENYKTQCIKTLTKKNTSECIDNNFLFYLSLLQIFNLSPKEHFSIKVTHSPFWFPYLSGKKITIDIENSNSQKKILHNLFTIRRNNLTWEIDKINIESPDILKTFEHLKKTLILDKYVKKTENGYILHESYINIKNMPNIEKMILKFNLTKLITI